MREHLVSACWNDLTSTLDGGKSLSVWGQMEIDGHLEGYKGFLKFSYAQGALTLKYVTFCCCSYCQRGRSWHR